MNLHAYTNYEYCYPLTGLSVDIRVVDTPTYCGLCIGTIKFYEQIY